MALQFSTPLKNKLLDCLTGISPAATAPIMKFLNSSNSFLRFQTGTIPATIGTANSGSALNGSGSGTSLSNTLLQWVAPTAGVASLAASANISVSTSGTAGYFEIKQQNSGYLGDSSTGAILRGSVGVVGSGADMILSTTAFSSPTPIQVTNFAIGWPLTLGTVKISTSLANALINMLIDGTDIGWNSTGAMYEFYSGSAPASADTAPTGTLIAQHIGGGWLAASGGAAAMDPGYFSNLTIVATGNIGYCVLSSQADPNQRLYCSVGTSGADILLSKVNSVGLADSIQITASTLSF